ncbi:MAG TPA: nucleotidyltransferase domain-containing protein [Acidimicrobiia bacterium]|jgi:predicted nucleotidyltransferase|nr:nucleotidyltransferase domain-containing protein [Acidimicrobiia bacterium]
MPLPFDEDTQMKIDSLCREYGVGKLWLFGSYARGEQTDESDFDFVYLMNRKEYGWEIYVFADELEEVLGRKVDIVPYLYMKPPFKARVEKEMVSVYEAA